MSHFALLGRHTGRSFSKSLFDLRFKGLHRYELLSIESLTNLRQLVAEGHLSGFNVTTPFKTAVIPYLDRLTDEAAVVGAVNCVKTAPDGSLTGHNTDAEAFFQTLTPQFLATASANSGTTALILGTGGAALAVASALCRAKIGYLFVSRHPDDHKTDNHSASVISYSQACLLVDKVSLIVNATPVGMYPDIASSPWPWPEKLSVRHLVYDLIYNPSPTRFMREAAAAGAHVADGLEMLRLQAELSWQYWGIV